MKDMKTLEELCKIVDKRLDMAVDELSREGGKLSMEDAKYIDLLTHTQKSIKTTMAMEGYGNSERRGRDSMGRYTSRADGPDGDGNTGWGYYPGRAWDDGRSYRGEGRSMHGDEIKDKLRRMADEADDERVRNALRTAMQQM